MNTETPFFTLKSFNELSPVELYTIIRLRNEVFVVEQNCVFQDADNKDQDCHHLMYWKGNELIAYCRLVPPGLAYEEMSIGRVVSAPGSRGISAGKQLIAEAIDCCKQLFGNGHIRIGAQCYLINFYGSFGFKTDGAVYLEDGIEHVEMVK